MRILFNPYINIYDLINPMGEAMLLSREDQKDTLYGNGNYRGTLAGVPIFRSLYTDWFLGMEWSVRRSREPLGFRPTGEETVRDREEANRQLDEYVAERDVFEAADWRGDFQCSFTDESPSGMSVGQRETWVLRALNRTGMVGRNDWFKRHDDHGWSRARISAVEAQFRRFDSGSIAKGFRRAAGNYMWQELGG